MSIHAVVSKKNEKQKSSVEEKIRGDFQLLRQATVGRITSIIVHQINNPLQAIQGAATLGLEELNDPQALKTYLEMICSESGRVFRMTEILRSIYNPDLAPLGSVSIKQKIEEVMLFIKDDLNRKGISFTFVCPNDLKPVRAPESQIIVALLNLFLDLDEVVSCAGHKQLTLDVREKGDAVVLNFSTDFPFSMESSTGSNSSTVDLSMIRRFLKSIGGTIVQKSARTGSQLYLSLPTAGVEAENVC